MKINDIPKNRKVLKPWGSEYTIFRNSISSTKLLRINYNKRTSLHCHPIKKTGFILIKGKVNVDLGFYNSKKMTSVSRLMIRPGLFHCTKNFNKETATILEIETPIDKDDLVRFKDNYGRENKPYENYNYTTKVEKKDPVFKEPKINSSIKYVVDNTAIKIIKTNNLKKLQSMKKNSIIAVLEGGLKSSDNKLVLSPGDIVGMDTIKKLTEVFKIKNHITYLAI
jgi:mannose-6-phosphate isomerase-like protein (cupin superfamily)|tara:strand:+ start:32 stop:703 length:672 start_codon:yes stop_codon:yes gene_type:complete